MHPLFWILSVFIGLAAFSGLGFTSPSQEALINEFLDRSSIRESFQTIAEKNKLPMQDKPSQSESAQQAKAWLRDQIKRAAETNHRTLPDVEREQQLAHLQDELAQSLRLDTTQTLMEIYLRGQPRETLESVVEWLRTPLVHELLAPEPKSKPLDVQGYKNYVTSIKGDGPRAELIKQLEHTTQDTEIQMPYAAGIATVEATIFVMGFGKPADWKVPAVSEAAVRKEVLRRLAFIHRDKSDEELKRYLQVLESPLGKSYLMMRRKTLEAGLARAREVFDKFSSLLK